MKPMTNEQLNAIKERCERASPIKVERNIIRGAHFVVDSCCCSDRLEFLDRADHEFFSCASRDIPALVAEVERLRALVGEMPSPGHLRVASTACAFHYSHLAARNGPEILDVLNGLVDVERWLRKLAERE